MLKELTLDANDRALISLTKQKPVKYLSKRDRAVKEIDKEAKKLALKLKEENRIGKRSWKQGILSALFSKNEISGLHAFNYFFSFFQTKDIHPMLEFLGIKPRFNQRVSQIVNQLKSKHGVKEISVQGKTFLMLRLPDNYKNSL